MTDDDVRDMLHAKAAEATVSPDAWDRIESRLAEPERSRTRRRLAVAGGIAAAVAATVFVANLPEPATHVATPSTMAVPAPATTPVPDPTDATTTTLAGPIGSRVAVWPDVDSVGLAALQSDADAGRRPELVDPVAVAGAFLSNLLPRDESPTSFAVGSFQRGDANSGEVPYTLSSGSGGVILVRTIGEPGSIWYVTGATNDALGFTRDPRQTGTALEAEVESTRWSGTLLWPGAPPVEATAGHKAVVSHPGQPVGAYGVVIRLMDGDRTLAVVARLG